MPEPNGGPEKVAIPDGIVALFFSTSSQQIFECVVDVNLTKENRHKLIPKAKILDDIKNRAAVSDFSPVKQKISVSRMLLAITCLVRQANIGTLAVHNTIVGLPWGRVTVSVRLRLHLRREFLHLRHRASQGADFKCQYKWQIRTRVLNMHKTSSASSESRRGLPEERGGGGGHTRTGTYNTHTQGVAVSWLGTRNTGSLHTQIEATGT